MQGKLREQKLEIQSGDCTIFSKKPNIIQKYEEM